MILDIPIFQRTTWIGLLSVAIFYAGYINMRFLETLISNQKTEFSAFGVHISRCVISIGLTFWAYDGFVAHSGEKALVYNYTNATVDRGTDWNWIFLLQLSAKTLTKRSFFYSDDRTKEAKSLHSFLQDQMILNCTLMLYPVALYFVAFFLWNKNSAQFLYAFLPQEWQTLTALTLCSLWELIVVLFWMAQAHIYVIYHMPFQQRLQFLLQSELLLNAYDLFCNVSYAFIEGLACLFVVC